MSIHQPAYLPWLGYFDRIAASDLFIVLDSVQFEKNSFTNRNRIKTPSGPLWLTVPVRLQGHLEKPLSEIEIDTTQGWTRKHLRSIEQNYRQAAGFNDFDRLTKLYNANQPLLADLCFSQLNFWMQELSISTPVVRASEMAIQGQKSELVLALCKKAGADTYLSGPMGRDYLDESLFASAGIKVEFHDYAAPAYPQLSGVFVPGLSVVDYWLNCPDRDMFKARR